MASLREKVEAELEQMDLALRELPGVRRVSKLSVLELGGTASLLSSMYHSRENILNQGLLSLEVALPSGAAWHRDLLQSACEQGIISTPQEFDSAKAAATAADANLKASREETTRAFKGDGGQGPVGNGPEGSGLGRSADPSVGSGRALKLAILHRRNSLGYKTQNGARLGDMIMSLIHTCRLCAANPLDYLNALQRHAKEALEHPTQWLPWNYRQALPPFDGGCCAA